MEKTKGHAICWIMILVIFMGIVIMDSSSVNAKVKSDKQIVKEYCNEHYKGYQIRYFTEWNDEIMSHRANKKIVYVQIEKSVSSGLIDSRNDRCWGYVKGQYYYKTWYCKKVARGTIVKSYYIFNPKNNYCDDIVAVVDNNLLR